MFCKNCGNPLGPDDKFCNVCGQTVNTNNIQPQAPQGNFNQAPQAQPNPQNGFAQPPQGNFNQPPQAPGEPNPQMGFNQPQPPGFNQPPMPQNGFNQQPNAYQANNMPPEKKNNIAFIIIIAVIVVAIIGVILYLVLNNGDDKPTEQNKPDNQTTTQHEDVSSAETIVIDDYKFSAPSGYIVRDTTSGKVFISNSSKTALYVHMHKNLAFTNYKNSVASIKNQLESESGVTITNYETKVVNGVELLIFYGTVSASSGTYSFADAYSSVGTYDTAEYMLFSYTSKKASNFISDIAQVAKNAKYTGSSSFAQEEPSTEDATATKVEFEVLEEFKSDEPNVLEEESE